MASGTTRAHFFARSESSRRERSPLQPLASSLIVSLARGQQGPATGSTPGMNSPVIDFRYLPPPPSLPSPLLLSPRSQQCINYCAHISQTRDRYYLVHSPLPSCIQIQAQMEDKGVGLIDQTPPAPVCGLAENGSFHRCTGHFLASLL